MNKFIVLLNILLILSPIAVNSAEAPKKVAHVTGIIDEESFKRYYDDVVNTANLPGDRTIYIDSLGGYLTYGQQIIDLMEAEKAEGVKMTCIVTGEATSMAFNILTHCDRRLASRDARFLVHKAAIGMLPPWLRPTAKNLRLIANDLDRADMPYRAANKKAMHLSDAEYDRNADEEKTWTAQELVSLGYLNGYVK